MTPLSKLLSSPLREPRPQRAAHDDDDERNDVGDDEGDQPTPKRKRRSTDDVDDEGDDEEALALARRTGVASARAVLAAARRARTPTGRGPRWLGPPQRKPVELTDQQRAAAAKRMIEIHNERTRVR